MKKIVFLILHYYTIEDTIKCVESIEKLEYNNKEIVIVDNASPNGTGKLLKDKYKNNSDIHIILSKENLGFANGNNMGFKYAKENLNADFIVMCNNDTMVIEKDFVNSILSKYEEYGYAVLGPKILLKNNKVNKLYFKLPTTKDFKKEIKYFKKMLFFNYLHIEKILRTIKHKLIKQNDKEDNKGTDEFQQNIILHGCFLVFSPKYLKKFNGLDNRTFMYREEELLAIRLLKNNMLSIYCPDIQIYHDEYGATRAVSKSNYKKNRFFYRNQLKSCNIILKELKNMKL